MTNSFIDEESQRPLVPITFGSIVRKILINIIPFKILKKLEIRDSSTAVKKLVAKILIPQNK